jgi:hypothetical protein
MSDSLVRRATGQVAPVRKLDEYPVLRRMMREAPLRYTQYEKEFYEMSAMINEVTATYSAMKREGQAAEIGEYLGLGKAGAEISQEQLLYGMQSTAQRTRQQASLLNQQIRLIRLEVSRARRKRPGASMMLKQKESLFRTTIGLYQAQP